MLIGIIFYRKTYPWYKHVGTLLLCSGIVAFSYWKQSSGSGGSGGGSSATDDTDSAYSLLIGILLVVMNLSLDGKEMYNLQTINPFSLLIVLLCFFVLYAGYTNNEQEHIFKKYSVSSFQMMQNVNLWQVIFLGLYLVFMHQISVYHDSGSELQLAYHTFSHCPQVRLDIGMFCVCAAIGQLTIFVVMKEFGSLMWITISITRKLFTILVSVLMFNHSICFQQWLGVAAVFSGAFLICPRLQCHLL